MNYDAALNYGSSIINITGKVVNPTATQTAQSVLTSTLDTLSFPIGISDRKSDTKSVTIKNTGAKLNTAPTISLSNSDNFSVLVNRCSKALAVNETCMISLVYFPKTTNSATGTLSIGSKTINLSGYRMIDVIPVGSTDIDTIEIEATKSVTHSITPLTQGMNLTWSIIPPVPNGVSINVSTGEITAAPALTDIGTKSFQIKAVNSAGSYVKNLILITKPLVDVVGLSFEEGEVGNNLMDIKIKSGVKVNKVVSSNLSTFITPIRVKKDGAALDNYARLSDDSSGNTITVNASSSLNNFIELTIDGGVKFKSAGTPLELTLQTDAGSFAYSFPITIATSGLQYIRYDIFGVKGDNTLTGDSPTDMLENMAEYKRVTAGWRRPIITNFRVKELNCGSGNIGNFYGDQVNIKNCMSSNASSNSETSFWFSQTFASAGVEIGGQASGLTHGVAIQKHPWFYTMAHEYGHNLGLFHTFESAGNLTNFSAQLSHNGSYVQMTDAVNRRGVTFPGDWLDYKFDYSTSLGIVSFSYGVPVSDTEIDYYSSKKTSLIASGFNALTNSPFVAGDQIFIVSNTSQDYYGARSVSPPYACEQSAYNTTTKNWTVNCDPSAPMTQASVRNIMSYWYKINDETSVFTVNQKLRMEKTLQVNSYLGAQ